MPRDGKHLKKHQFKPGQSGNKNGRPKLPAEIVEARKLTKQQFETLLHRILRMTRPQVEEIVTSIHTDMLEQVVGSIVLRAVTEGCTTRLNFILDRLIGKASFAETPGDLAPPTVEVEQSGPVYIVELNENGKFLRARPREIEVTAQAANE